MVSVVMHYNPHLPHQVRHAEAFRSAGVETSPIVDFAADIHIVSGPHYALSMWRGHRNLLVIDRAFYGDPDYVQMFWLNPDGTRTYACGDSPRYSPQLLPWKEGEGYALLLADFQQDVSLLMDSLCSRFGTVVVRRHPAELGLKSGEMPKISLESQLENARVCIGHSSTALFEAVVAGVPVICADPDNIVSEMSVSGFDEPLYRGDREAWLHKVSYMQWNHEEFGTALKLLLAQRNL